MQFTLLNAFIYVYDDYTYVYLYTPLYPSFLSANANVEITGLYNHICIYVERERSACTARWIILLRGGTSNAKLLEVRPRPRHSPRQCSRIQARPHPGKDHTSI